MPHDLYDKDGKRKMRPGSGKQVQPLDETELEIVKADMKFLIEEEKKNGDWAKWQRSQRPMQQWRQMNRDIVNLTVTVRVTRDGHELIPPVGLEDAIINEINSRYQRQDMPSRIAALEADRLHRMENEVVVHYNDQGQIDFSALEPPIYSRRVVALPFYCVGDITPEVWQRYVGRPPVNDDIERANCPQSGVGHYGCGWCNDCQKPRWLCGHLRIP